VDDDVSPLLIVGLVILGLVVAVFLFGLTPDPRRRRDPGLLRRRSRWWAWLPVVPLLAAIGCLALAFSGFRFRLQEVNPIAMLVLDASRSMTRDDVAPTRLDAARSAALAFLDVLPPEFEVGLTTFGSGASVPVAPTADREEVIDALRNLEADDEAGTVIGEGIAATLDEIERTRSGRDVPAAMLLLSDGADRGSEIEPEAAARQARSTGVPIHGVWLGDPAGDDADDLRAMERISGASGAQTFTAESRGELIQRFRTLGTRFSVDLAADPSSTPLVVAAIAFVVLAGLLLVLAPR
jgi:Ca-activated chloride channel family protein